MERTGVPFEKKKNFFSLHRDQQPALQRLIGKRLIGKREGDKSRGGGKGGVWRAKRKCYWLGRQAGRSVGVGSGPFKAEEWLRQSEDVLW